MSTQVVIVIGAGSIGQAIARRVSAGKHVVLADLRQENADSAAGVLRDAGFDTSTTTLDVSSREQIQALVATASEHGDITGVIHAAGVSPSQAPIEAILAVDLYGTAVLLEEFGNVIAPGGAGVVIASQSGHRLPALTTEQDTALATTPADELLSLPWLQPDQITDTLHAYQLAKRANALRVKGEAVHWAQRDARINTISPGIIMTPLANDELTGPRGEGYRRMLERSPAGRAGTPDEVATLAALLMGADGAFITGSDFLMDGGVTASYLYGELAPEMLVVRTDQRQEQVTMTEIMARDAQGEIEGPEQCFTGRVTIRGQFSRDEPSRVAGAIVTFQPGARTAWHSHPLGQTLIVIEGVGWTQVEDDPIQEFAAGDILLCPRERRHWHGATPDSSMSHVAIQEALDGTTVTWMEKVTDDEYLAGPR